LKDGKHIKGKSFETTPADIAKKISKKLAESVLVAKVAYTKKLDLGLKTDCVDPEEEKQNEKGASQYYDLERPLEGDCNLDLITFDDPQGKHVNNRILNLKIVGIPIIYKILILIK